MTTFDTIFQTAATEAGFSWAFVFDIDEHRKLVADREITSAPCILRQFNEPLIPLFNPAQMVERDLSLYIIHVGFKENTSEQINVNLEDILTKFIEFREIMKDNGIILTLTQKPYPAWEQTNLNEYGLVINLTAKYVLCQS